MKRNIAVLALVLFGLYGCGTKPYTPRDYGIGDGVIPRFAVKSSTSVRNTQNSTEEAIVYSYAGTKLASNYNAITQVMVDQVAKELAKNGNKDAANAQKTIDLKVTYLLSTYYTFHWRSELRYTAVLGNGKTLEKTVRHGHGILLHDLNGCIAEAVIDLLKDPVVVAYLGS